jgi:hypothetical protein
LRQNAQRRSPPVASGGTNRNRTAAGVCGKPDKAYLYKEQADYDSTAAQHLTTKDGTDAITVAIEFIALIHQALA